MDPINENKTAEAFPFESLYRLRHVRTPQFDSKSDFNAQSYDNRTRISSIASALQSKLGFFKTRLSSNLFLSGDFSWLVKTAVSGNSSSLLAKSMNGADEKAYSFKIDLLATSRTVQSKRLVSRETTQFSSGNYSYTMTVGNESFSIDLNVDNEADDPLSNRDLLVDIERSINNLGAGITAQLEDVQIRDYNPYRENAIKKLSYLTVKNDNTGDDVDFSLSDTDGEIIDTLKLNQVYQFGAENQYRVNGQVFSSDSNNVVIASDTLGAYLLQNTEPDQILKVNVKQGRNVLSDELIQIIDDHNTLMEWIDENESIISPTLKVQLFKGLSSLATKDQTVTVERFETRPGEEAEEEPSGFGTKLNIENHNTIDNSLKEIGLTLNSDGTIDIGDKFSKAVASDLLKVHQALAGENGLFTRIAQSIETIHGRQEDYFVFSFNSILSYSPEGTDRQSIYKENSSSIINLFA